jgi:hypothetical protein
MLPGACTLDSVSARRRQVELVKRDIEQKLQPVQVAATQLRLCRLSLAPFPLLLAYFRALLLLSISLRLPYK